jgi:hypothetical protein
LIESITHILESYGCILFSFYNIESLLMSLQVQGVCSHWSEWKAHLRNRGKRAASSSRMVANPIYRSRRAWHRTVCSRIVCKSLDTKRWHHLRSVRKVCWNSRRFHVLPLNWKGQCWGSNNSWTCHPGWRWWSPREEPQRQLISCVNGSVSCPSDR